MDKDIQRIIKRLDELVPEVVRINEAAMDEALDMVLASARQNAPVKTGQLRDNIEKRKRRRGGTVRGTIGVKGRISKKGAPGDPHMDAAMANEFGTQFMSAQPFLYPALKNNRARIRELFAARHREGLRKG